MDENKSFIDGFIQGWQSVVGHVLDPPEVQVPVTNPKGSRFIHGLIEGIEAAKRKIAELH